MDVRHTSRRLPRTLIPLLLMALLGIAHPTLSAACSQSGHAWFNYTSSGQTSVDRGGSIWLAAAGVVGQVTFNFHGEAGVAYSYTTASANGNCVVNQELFGVNFIPGSYTLTATFQDGNTGRLVIDANAGTMVVNEPATPPAGSANCAQTAHVFFSPSTLTSGQSITAGAVAFPGTFSEIRIRNSFKQLVQSFYLPPAAGNCVENQRTIPINLPPGTYSVRADFIDENNILHNDPIGTLTVN